MIGLAVWLAFAGLWPFADPGHSMTTPLSVIDVVIHCAAVVVLWCYVALRWDQITKKLGQRLAEWIDKS